MGSLMNKVVKLSRFKEVDVGNLLKLEYIIRIL